jgi:hypothetical protein
MAIITSTQQAATSNNQFGTARLMPTFVDGGSPGSGGGSAENIGGVLPPQPLENQLKIERTNQNIYGCIH